MFVRSPLKSGPLVTIEILYCGTEDQDLCKQAPVSFDLVERIAVDGFR
jgi:hypothetical protein